MTIGLLAGAMAAALFPVIGVGMLSKFILEDLGINRTQLGLVITVAAATSAVAAMTLGRLTDRQGGRNALMTVFLLGGLAMAGIAFAPTFIFLLGAAAIAGLAMGSANPATNRLVVETIPKRQWGTITGVKQAGEALAIVLCGSLYPIAALAMGWRWTFAVTALILGAAIALVFVTIPGKRRTLQETPTTRSSRPLDRNILWLTAYASVVGLSAGSIATYLPLYSQEALAMSPSSAGLLLASMGVVAVVGRVVWGHLARDSTDLRSRLRSIALLAVGAVFLIWSASVVNPNLVWLGAAAWGASLLSVGALGNLAVMAYSVVEDTGRASGVMLTGFGFGLMIGPPIFGWTVDTTGAYHVGFGLLVVELVTLSVIASIWAGRPRTAAGASPQLLS